MSKPRILGGEARGRELDTPRSGTRPTPAKLREAIFNSLQFRAGSFLDLFSGSGAMGLEAASRGWEATSVELARPAAAVIKGNARRLGLQLTVITGDALKFAREHSGFDVVFASPPYTVPGFEEFYYDILEAGPAAPGGLYLLQHPSSIVLAGTRLPAWAEVRRRVYGNNTISEIAAPEAADSAAGN